MDRTNRDYIHVTERIDILNDRTNMTLPFWSIPARHRRWNGCKRTGKEIIKILQKETTNEHNTRHTTL